MDMDQAERRIFLIRELLKEQPRYRHMEIPRDKTGQKQLLRSLMNIRMPGAAAQEFLEVQDAYLQEETAGKGIVVLEDMSCYRSCLELAEENHLESIAFCCISTGEFHFPNDIAAQIAVRTVEEFMQKEPGIKKVVFNVFKDLDKKIYEELFRILA